VCLFKVIANKLLCIPCLFLVMKMTFNEKFANFLFIYFLRSGTQVSNGRGPSFLGSAIVREVIRELADFEQLLSADELILAGSSAGATGVLINLDAVAEAVQPSGLHVRGIVDSGWFLDGGDNEEDCAVDPTSSRCSVINSLKEGIKLWAARVPHACQAAFPEQPWKCFFGYRVYPIIKSKFQLWLISCSSFMI